jgi:hypothetical protein
MLPRRIPKKPKRATRWRSQAHCNFVRGFACCMCGSTTNIVPAHVRLGTHTGASQKPDDWRVAPLCDGPCSDVDGMLGCHNRQHLTGEATFWRRYEMQHGQTVETLLAELCAASPKAAEIRLIKAERAREAA